MTLAGAWFGTDGIRDVAGEGRLAPRAVTRVGWALGQFASVRASGRQVRALLARDSRPSADALAAQLAGGLARAGSHVEDAGMLPTPALAYAVARGGYDLGVMISASHNPSADNGLKPFLAPGRKATEADEAEIEAGIARAPTDIEPAPAAALPAPVWRSRYVEETAAWLAPGGSLAGCRVIVDLSAGAATTTAVALLERLGAVVTALHPAGERPINEDCGTEHPAAWLAAVRARPGWIGLALDGDADRVVLADEGGERLDGDDLLGVLARDFVATRGGLPADVVVGTVMTNLGLEELLARHGLQLERAQVGDRHVAECLRERGGVLGGEPSGHVILARDDLDPPLLVGDAVVAGIRVLQAARRFGRSLASLRADRRRHPQRLVNVRMNTRRSLAAWPAFEEALEAERARLGSAGRLVVRYSGTEPLLRIMGEGADESAVFAAVDALAEVARREANQQTNAAASGRGAPLL